MNEQEIFDKVLNHLRQQGEASVSDSGCVYRNNEGKSCAVGCLIPNEMYTPEIEGVGIYRVKEYHMRGFIMDLEQKIDATIALEKVLSKIGLMENLQLLESLQFAHDTVLRWVNVETWEREMSGIAGSYGLTYNPPV